ncbi:phosphotransferase [Cytobacillus suaedae]|nr:phosphotransferase [Cytobacillus suaedae]
MKGNRIRLSGGFHNDVFLIEGEDIVERISDQGKSEDMVLQEIEWMNFLYERGVALPKPNMSLKVEDGRVRSYFQYIRAEHIDVTNITHWNGTTFKQLGRILGKMHSLSKEFEIDIKHRPVWTVENPDVFGIRENLSPWMAEKYDRLMDSLTSYETTPDTFGLIHNDFHQGNVMINKEGKLTIIDFDECAFNWFAQDIGVIFYHAYWQHCSFNGNASTFSKTFLEHFFLGYQEENILHYDVINQIPTFLKLREIFLYQLFHKKWDMENLEEWQRYTLHDLEYKIKLSTPYGGITDFVIYV